MSIEKIADLLLEQAIKLNATDIHIIPRQDDYLTQFRLYGRLIPHRPLPAKIGERLVSHFKFMASLDIGEKRKPQSGSFQLSFVHQYTSLRISTLPTANSKESLVIRILSNQQTLSINQMSLFPSSAKKLLSLLMHSHGLLLFTGPTGSGKSTTMYTLVEKSANHAMRNVITLEDPVEIKNEHFLQVQVNEKAGITYSNGLRAVLRHDPDIIIVGEIRDHETAEIAVRAALTGHLVLSTMHTRDAKGAIYRLLEFGIKQMELEQTLIGITAQRLVTLSCPFCGDRCSKYCSRYHEKRRAAVYELLYGKSLKCVLDEASGLETPYQYVTLREILRKGIALGYISKQEYNRWVFETEQANLERAGYIFK